VNAIHILAVLVLMATAAFLGLRQLSEWRLGLVRIAGMACGAVLIAVDRLR
jgi:hypothetical protein